MSGYGTGNKSCSIVRGFFLVRRKKQEEKKYGRGRSCRTLEFVPTVFVLQRNLSTACLINRNGLSVILALPFILVYMTS